MPQLLGPFTLQLFKMSPYLNAHNIKIQHSIFLEMGNRVVAGQALINFFNSILLFAVM